MADTFLFIPPLGVESINNADGEIAIAGGTGITVSTVGDTITIDGFGWGYRRLILVWPVRM